MKTCFLRARWLKYGWLRKRKLSVLSQEVAVDVDPEAAAMVAVPTTKVTAAVLAAAADLLSINGIIP